MGCDFETFKNHIESLLRNGVTFDDYGRGENQWTLDHIVPYRYFNVEDEQELLKCCNYKNTQPLSLSENAKKRNRLPNGMGRDRRRRSKKTRD